MLYSSLVVSKNGSLLHAHQPQVAAGPLRTLGANDLLVMASNLHGIHAIASQMSTRLAVAGDEQGRPGLRWITCDQFNIFIHQSPTGLKLVLFVSPDVNERLALALAEDLRRAYYKYVMKSPFYELDMPIRISVFDSAVEGIFQKSNVLQQQQTLQQAPRVV